MIEDTTAAIAARETEKAALVSDSDLGVAGPGARSPRSTPKSRRLKEKLAGLEAEWATEQKLVSEIRSLRDILNPPQAAGRQATSRRRACSAAQRRRHREPATIGAADHATCASNCAKSSRRSKGAIRKSG